MEIVWRMVITFFFLGVIDLYSFQLVKSAFPKAKWLRWTYWVIVLLTYGYILLAITGWDPASTPRKVVNTFLGVLILLYVPKTVMAITLLIQDIFRLGLLVANEFRGRKKALAAQPNDGSEEKPNPNNRKLYKTSRRTFLSQIGLGVAAIPFTSILYGIIQGRYDFRVIKKTLAVENLPEALDGLRILQISDVHSGSFTNREKIAYGVDMINAQKADVVFFTGDLVNNQADEMEEWKELFSTINAPMGVYSVFGNHDYGDYVTWPSEQDKVNNLSKLAKTHGEMGYNLLRNQNVTLEREGQKIHVAGVENWGYPPFPQYGDLNKALEGINPGEFTILMSHDPSHFDGEVKQHPVGADLTLSGHTHGMQFGIEIPGWIKWSPVKYKYPKWAGLYEENNRYLYVNRGFGYLAFPGRVGIWPEITVLELRKQ
jgi:predicted MPP superfamily phosphohydrolase